MRVRHSRHLLPLLAGSLLAGLVASVQAQPLSEQNLLPGLTPSVRFEHITAEDGLLDNRINGFLHDGEGYMWFGSQDGLSRFDGYEFKTFWSDTRDSTSLSGNYIEVLFEDHTNTMWVGTWGTGANRYDRETETFERFRHDPDDPASLADDQVAAIAEDAQGNLWFGTENGLSRFEAATGSFTTYRHDPEDEGSLLHNIVRSLLVDREGVLWVGTGSQFGSPLDAGGLHRYDPDTDSFIRYPGDTAGLVGHHVVALHEDRSGTLWVGTASGGVHRMDRDAGTFMPLAPDLRAQGFLTFMHEDRAGRFWVGTSGGVNLVDRETGTFDAFLPDPADPSSLSVGRVWRIYEDRSGTLWIGCGSEACLEKVKTEPRPFRHHTWWQPGMGAGARRAGSPAMYELRDGALLLGTSQGIAMLDRRRGQIVPHPVLSAALPDRWNAIYEDSEGLIWAGAYRRLLAFDPVSGQLKDYTPTLFRPTDNGTVWSIGEAADRTIWLGSEVGLFRLDPATEQTNRIETAPGSATDILLNAGGTIWVGTFNGLFLFDLTTGTTTPSLLDRRHVWVIHPAAGGALWVGMDAGLAWLDPASGTVRIYTRADGLPNNTIVGIAEDDRYLWLATRTAGISRFDPQEEVFLNFDRRDGLGGLSFYSAVKDQAGRLYFYGPHGISEYVGGQSTINQTPPEVHVTGLTARNRPVPLDFTEEVVQLGHEENDLSLHFQGFHYDNPARNQHRVRLDPLDASWVDPGTQRQVRYTNLDPGTYTFRVRAANSDGVWSKEEATLRIIILPPWWQTWWAYLLFGLLFLGGIVAVDRFQRRRLIARERERARARELEQAREIERAYHELRETKDRLVQQEKMASLGQLTAGIAHEIKNPLNFINNFAEVNEELAQELREDLTDYPDALAAVEDLLADLKQNAQVINQHGKRADAIVHAMMQHASGRTGRRQPTDVNALVAEHVDLAYHGKRAQVPDLKVELERDLAGDTGDVEIVPQEIGRVLLNLLGNAFDAVHEQAQAVDGKYTPGVTVNTRQVDGQVEIRVSDNGPGIPEDIRDRIFEPFFTTKPTGSGTGLGLSLSYDIVTQGHGGTLKVESTEGEGATFVITLPRTVS